MGDLNMFYVFKAKTPLAATYKARRWLLKEMPGSRADYEDEHGNVTDDKWLRVIGELDYKVHPAKWPYKHGKPAKL
jgi:hypothetical protein